MQEITMKDETSVDESSTAMAATVSRPMPSGVASTPAPFQKSGRSLLVGFDLGTNSSCVLSGPKDSTDYDVSKVVPTVVGYVKEGIVSGILPSGSDVLFGDDALKNKLHLRLVWPVHDGLVAETQAMRDFITHIRNLVVQDDQVEIRAVIGVPANADEGARENVRKAVTGIFDRVLLIPEPFLAALGFREDGRLGQKNYVDPVMNSLFVDIGAGTTDLCLVQGYFPGPEDQISFSFAGDSIDARIAAGLAKVYPDLKLSDIQIREMKEEHAYCGPSRRPIDVRVIIGGKGRTIEVADILGDACNELVDRIYEALIVLIERASSDSVRELLQNILVTGGGSQIRGIDTVLQQRLEADGYENPRVRTVGREFKRFVGIGALKAARAARDNQWQVVFR